MQYTNYATKLNIYCGHSIAEVILVDTKELGSMILT